MIATRCGRGVVSRPTHAEGNNDMRDYLIGECYEVYALRNHGDNIWQAVLATYKPGDSFTAKDLMSNLNFLNLAGISHLTPRTQSSYTRATLLNVLEMGRHPAVAMIIRRGNTYTLPI